MTFKTFTLDRVFLEEVHARLLTANRENLDEPLKKPHVSLAEIPDIEQLEEIISTVFWASIQTEEGRTSTFRVQFGRPSREEHLGFLFTPEGSKDWNTKEVRKLAPSIVPPDGQICVYPFEGSLKIYGLQTSGSLGVSFEVIEPGKIAVRFPTSYKIAIITGPKSGFIDDKWYRKCLDLTSTYDRSGQDVKENDMLSFLYGEMNREILKRMRLLKHGGTLLFVSESSWQESVEEAFYRGARPYNGLRYIQNELEFELSSTIDSTKKAKKARELMGSHKYKTFIADSARTMAYMTAVDGAVLISREFGMIGFGAKIKESDKQNQDHMVIKIAASDLNSDRNETPLSHEFRGKRHLSAARFILNNTDSVAFTVSQDGGITCFIMEDLKLVAYKGLELVL